MNQTQKIIEELSRLGVDLLSSQYKEIQKSEADRRDYYLSELYHFLKSYDFMRFGQAVNRGQWEAAYMTLRRMEQRSAELGFHWGRSMTGLKHAVRQKNAQEAKQILTTMIAKRVQFMTLLQSYAEILDQSSIRY